MFAKQKYFYVTSTFMHLLSAEFMQTGSVWGFLPRNRFKRTISFSGTGLFYDRYSFQNLFLFRKYILFRNCFCQTNPFQEWSSQKLSFDVSFEQKNYWIPIKSEVSYHPFSGTVMSDTTLFEAHRIPSSFRSCHFWHCLFQDGSISNPLQKSF